MMLDEITKPKERRHSERWVTDKTLSWRRHHGKKIRSCPLTERSLNSIAFLSPASDAPPIGAIVHPADERGSLRHGFRVGVVRRKEEISGDQLVFMEILA